ncbi:MAG TPA: hypothetical protein PKD18_20520, partial [Saprospiraceae bacterium]|nr:hypothetical protein [Saprospiraceae bacterium]
MKILSTLILVLFSCMLFSQSGEVNYQALIKDKDGNPLASKNVQIEISFAVGGEVYNETLEGTTDEFGLLSYHIGGDDLAKMDWAKGGGTMSTKIITDAGTLDFGSKSIAAVPYAFYALNSGSSTPGPAPRHEWEGTMIRFENPDGSFGPWKDLKGSSGNSVTVVGSVPNQASLPANYTGNVGDMYISADNGTGFVWDG